jgi:hypothetical protein
MKAAMANSKRVRSSVPAEMRAARVSSGKSRSSRLVARLRVVGKHTGAHPRMPEPTGRDFDVEQSWIFTLADGLVTEIRAVSDRLGMFLQLGWDWPAAG